VNKVIIVLQKCVNPDCFSYWMLLAISMFSLPVYTLTVMYNGVSETYITGLVFLALSCVISIYIGAHFCGELASTHDKPHVQKPDRFSILDAKSTFSVNEYDSYIRKITSLNHYSCCAEDGTPKVITYSRSSSHI
jgi:hypothetical protein